jgi:prepilin-type N-terminal cleavage/methylation domain-containing protein
MKNAAFHPLAARKRAPRGLTLIELLVSVTILTVMILAFSTILVQSQRFISITQATRRSHALAATVARIVRNDIRRATQSGFMAIGADADNNGRLVFSTAGVTHGLVASSAGSGSLICYGLVMNDLDKTRTILWRPEYVYNDTEINPSFQTTDDSVQLSSLAIQSMSRDPNGGGLSLRDVAAEFLNKRPDDTLRVPPRELGQINDLWQVLGSNCRDLSVMWTDGQTRDTDANAVRWYGVDPTAPVAINPSNQPDIEPQAQGQSGYFALWTHENQANWPLAIKIRFKFTSKDEDMPKAFREGLEYEVICNIGD